jgi:hypothetical protein
MAVITPNTTYPNGAVLPVANHNANIYTTTSGRGIMSEPNGGLQVVNLDAAFTVRDEHIMPEEAVVARMDGTTIPMDVYNNAFGIRDDEDPVYVALAGLGQRVYVPYAMAAVLFQWSFHVSVFRPFMNNEENQNGPDLAKIAVRVFVDGVEQPAWRRNFPVSAQVDLTNDTFINQEQICPLWFDLSYLDIGVAAGYHEISVKLYLPRLSYNPQDLDPNPSELTIPVPLSAFSPSGTADTVNCTVHTRISFGVRNVRCVMFK